MRQLYEVQMKSGYVWRFAADLVEASAGLYYVLDDGEEVPTQWQTADASHRAWDAAELLVGMDEMADDEDEVRYVDPVDDQDDEDREDHT